MFCTNCGKEIGEGNRFCPYCGHEVTASENQNGYKSAGGGNELLPVKRTEKKYKIFLASS